MALARNPIFPTNKNAMEPMPTAIIETKGVLLSEWTILKTGWRESEVAIPYIILDAAKSIKRTVLLVANRAIMDKSSAPFAPSALNAI